MTYQQKMAEHIAAAEKWQAEVELIENKALAHARIESKRPRLHGREARHSDEYLASTLLKDNFEYKRAVGNRNGHQTMAQMYGVAALVEATQPEPEPEVKRPIPSDRCDDAFYARPHAAHEWRSTEGRRLWCQGA